MDYFVFIINNMLKVIRLINGLLKLGRLWLGIKIGLK